jgi:peptidylprolyl isomerase
MAFCYPGGPMFKLAPATLIVRIGAAALLTALAACQKGHDTSAAAPTAAGPAAPKAGLVIEDVKIGTGALATPGKTVSAIYTGTLTNGTKFDATADHDGKPIQFVLGAGRVIKGWDQGIDGMKVGGKRKLTIPPHLAYGEPGMGPIPPNATLLFDVELVGVK